MYRMYLVWFNCGIRVGYGVEDGNYLHLDLAVEHCGYFQIYRVRLYRKIMCVCKVSLQKVLCFYRK